MYILYTVYVYFIEKLDIQSIQLGKYLFNA